MKSEYTQRTANLAVLESAMYLRLPFTPLPNTTLNEKFSVNENVTLAENEYPSLGYWGIGRGGHKLQASADSGVNIVPEVHAANHSALYKHLPFVIRTLDNDLGDVERAKYALRVIEEIRGVEYVVYYLKRLDMAPVSIEVSHSVYENGTLKSEVPYAPSIDDLSPEPSNNDSYVSETVDERIKAKGSIRIDFTSDDVNEVLNACAIKYQDTTYAIVSEICLCSGVDRVTASPLGAGTIQMNEVGMAQVNNFVSTFQLLELSNGFYVDIDTGAGEPLSVSASE